jgi:malonyl-CoA/methylmalonyl-CoA synthetase
MEKLLKQASKFKDRIAIISDGDKFSYNLLIQESGILASSLCEDIDDLDEERIAFMIDPSYAYTVTQWAIWRAGGIAVPLCTSHPLNSIEYVLKDAAVSKLIVSDIYYDWLLPLAKSLNVALIKYNIVSKNSTTLPNIDGSRSAMILYTSGTTSLPKGVVTTHDNIAFCIESLTTAWCWSKEDHILNILPLHHVHGIINVMSCALWSGAICEFLPKFNAQQVWQTFQGGALTLFMAVPTIYYKLIRHWKNANEEEKKKMSASCASFRLMVSGSAALPIPVLNEWKDITGQLLLERYGMTEIGMALSNPYASERRPGHVGQPLPGVQIRLKKENGIVTKSNTPGEIQVKGPNVFKEYWRKPEATKKAYTEDGWFKTGDIAQLNDNYFQILGRDSIDIIKSGGYKISALEIESVLLKHPDIEQVGVIGIPDDEWGEVVSAAVVSSSNQDPKIYKEWLKGKLPDYRIPRRYILIDDLPKNTLGKVTKNKLKDLFIH